MIPQNLMRIRWGTAGIWLLSSRINHSCYINCQRAYIGNMQIVRAARDLPAGTELLIDYRTPGPFQTHAAVQDRLKSYGFTCTCPICQVKKKTTDAAFARCKSLKDDFDGIAFGKNAENEHNVDKRRRLAGVALERIIDQMEATLPAGPVQLELLWPYGILCGVMLRQDRPQEALRLAAKCLRTLDFEVTAVVLPRCEFRITRWGYVDEQIHMTLLRIHDAYRALKKPGARQASDEAKRYAEVAYSVHTGESVSMAKVHPELY